MTFPTIFDWLERLDGLRGFTAAYVVLLTAVLVIIIWDWRLALAALAARLLLHWRMVEVTLKGLGWGTGGRPPGRSQEYEMYSLHPG